MPKLARFGNYSLPIMAQADMPIFQKQQSCYSLVPIPMPSFSPLAVWKCGFCTASDKKLGVGLLSLVPRLLPSFLLHTVI